MIGCYIHHHGRGHLSRALAIAAALHEAVPGGVTGLSSLPEPPEWPGDWVQLPSDETPDPIDPTAGGRLHWAPRQHPGLRTRMARIARWIDEQRPDALLVDVSVEVALLARLHGIPVVVVAMPGDRRDPAHALGFAVADAVIGAWPPEATERLSAALPPGTAVQAVGAISRFAPQASAAAPTGARRVLVLGGAGGDDFTADAVARARDATPGWEWTHLGANGSWTDDPWAALLDASVVITHAGESAIAEVAAARRPAVVIPQARPHDEQRATAAVLSDGRWPALVRPGWPGSGWPALLDDAAALDPSRWRAWNDGGGAARAAAVILGVSARSAA